MLKLLVADDERILREAVCYLIDWKSIGIELAASCKNGREAYEEACRTKPDIILTDIKMPGLSGLDLVEKLSEPGRVLEFILLTGYADFEYAHRALPTQWCSLSPSCVISFAECGGITTNPIWVYP